MTAGALDAALVDLLRKDRTDGVTGEVLTGRVHIGNELAPGVTLCGNRPRGVVSRLRGSVADATCTGCVAAHRKGTARSYRRR